MKTNFIRSAAFAVMFAAVAVFLLPCRAPAQGSLTPPGAPAPTMKTLQQIEPRTPISSLPFTISNSGSYYLTTNLTGVAGTNGIAITANSVTLDLAGFTLAGGGSSNGVNVVGNRTNVVVRNGVIRNWSICVEAFTSSNCRFEALRFSDCSLLGLDAGDVTLVDSCQALRAGVYGISVNSGSTIKGCVASSNSIGIYANAGCTIVDCSAFANTRGIEADEGCTVKGCTASGGGNNNGILAYTGGTVIGCTVEGNQGDGISLDRGMVKDCTVHNNTGNGIDLFINCQAVGNTCVENIGAGIKSTGGGHSIVGNMVASNGRGISCNPSTGNLIIQNRASGNATNYDIAAGNTAGPIVTSANIATSTNPHANYSY